MTIAADILYRGVIDSCRRNQSQFTSRDRTPMNLSLYLIPIRVLNPVDLTLDVKDSLLKIFYVLVGVLPARSSNVLERITQVEATLTVWAYQLLANVDDFETDVLVVVTGVIDIIVSHVR